MASPAGKVTMLNYFTKLPSKTCIVEEANPRRPAPAYNKQHVENFQRNRLIKFDAELFNINNQLQDINKTSEDESYLTESVAKNGQQIISTNYIESIKSGLHKPFRVDKKPRGHLRSRLYQYCEDVRPAYFGTWQKRSTLVTARKPFSKDETVFDYEVDSEAEWDIGGPGESLKGDDSDDEKELADDYEIDMKTFVPHGYVSDDEIDEHSDQEEEEDNGPPSANQSIEEIICDEEDNSNASVKIVGEKRMKLSNQSNKFNNNNNTEENGSYSVNQKSVIKPMILGLHYESQQQGGVLNFLQAFKGFSCS